MAFKFPSPIGVLYISIFICECKIACHRFRPLLGFIIFQLRKDKMITRTIVFPSPIGVLYISIRRKNYEKTNGHGFRPLLGFIIFQFPSSYFDYIIDTSFRPLLGFIIFQCIRVRAHDEIEDCFRPLLGFIIFQ